MVRVGAAHELATRSTLVTVCIYCIVFAVCQDLFGMNMNELVLGLAQCRCPLCRP